VPSIILLFFMSLLTNTLPEIEVQTTSIQIEITGVRNANGHILIALFSNEKGFPDKSDKAFKKLRIPAQKGTVKGTFTAVPAGTYAYGVIHDENDNQKLDTGFFGIPKEGFVFSRNAMGTVGPPSFSDAAFKVENASITHSLKISYW
jgi:uncharacterized protein (DUF2141 family)